jgi:hypothetical protein
MVRKRDFQFVFQRSKYLPAKFRVKNSPQRADDHVGGFEKGHPQERESCVAASITTPEQK